MSKNKKINPLEELQETCTSMNFIKSYPILNNLERINPIQKQLIELVLSFQFDNKKFFMKYEDIAKLLKIKVQTLTNYISQLKDFGYIITNHKSNFNGIDGGSSSTLVVNVDNVISDIKYYSYLYQKLLIQDAIDKCEDEETKKILIQGLESYNKLESTFLN